MSNVHVFKVPLTTPAKDALKQFADDQGMPQISVLSRLLEWFAKEDHSLQHVILGLCPPDCTADLATLLLRRRQKAGEP